MFVLCCIVNVCVVLCCVCIVLWLCCVCVVNVCVVDGEIVTATITKFTDSLRIPF